MGRCRPASAGGPQSFIAGFGHIAVGLASWRLGASATERRRVVLRVAVAVLLAVLPDGDLIPVAFGVPDRGLLGHRGFSHTPLFAVLVGCAVFLRWRARRTGHARRAGLAAALLVASHGVLDAMSQEGRGILFLWPFSSQRFHLPWRPIPDAPTGLAFFSHVGMRHLAIELVYFFPLIVCALWPGLRRLARARRALSCIPARVSSRRLVA
jgi:inner membrane protein